MVQSPNKAVQYKILAAMAAYNESKYIGSLVLQARQYAGEVLVVDDGSTDNTAEIAALAGATVIQHMKNRGKGAAIQRILAEAKKTNTDILVLLDADFQHRPEDIPFLIKPILQGFDLAIGSRMRQRSDIPLYRRFGQRILAFFCRILSGEKVVDSESGFRALSSKAIAGLSLSQNGFAIESEMISVATEKGLAVTEVPISALYTKDGSTLNPVRHGFGVLNRIIVMISERRPLLFFGLFGGLFAALGLAAGIEVMWRYYFDTGVLATGTALISILFITVGLSCISTGVILSVLVKRIGN